MNEAALLELCREWQERLRLRDWDVNVLIVSHWNMNDDTWGRCIFKLSKKIALIKLLDPSHYEPFEGDMEYDMEQVLVHELLHLHFAPFVVDDDTPEDTAQEIAIEAISKALVAAKRENATADPTTQPAA